MPETVETITCLECGATLHKGKQATEHANGHWDPKRHPLSQLPPEAKRRRVHLTGEEA